MKRFSYIHAYIHFKNIYAHTYIHNSLIIMNMHLHVCMYVCMYVCMLYLNNREEIRVDALMISFECLMLLLGQVSLDLRPAKF
jgi:hypothetical protein